MEVKNFIEHAGILGMRWGHRKRESVSSPSGGSVTTSSPSKTNKDYDVVETIRKKKLSELSNDDIKLLANRMQLEQTYKQYQEQHKTNFERGKDTALKILGNIAVQSLTNVGNTYAQKYLGIALGDIEGSVKKVKEANVQKGIEERAKVEAEKRTAEKVAKEKAINETTNKLFYKTLTNDAVNNVRYDSFKVVSNTERRQTINAVDKVLGNISNKKISEVNFDPLPKFTTSKLLKDYWEKSKPVMSTIPPSRKKMIKVTDLDF